MITTDGKFFVRDNRRFWVRGVTYGTFAPRESDGHRFPPRERMKADFVAMNESGFNVVRTYTAPSDDLLELAADWELSVLAGVHWNDWRYLMGSSRRQSRAVARSAVEEVRGAARRLSGNDDVFALCVGNEIPADVVRWVGAKGVSELIRELVDTAHSEDPDRLVTYANYPSTEYLTLDGLDFATFNVFLERPSDLRRYLTRLHNLIGDEPLVIGEMGRHCGTGPGSERRQAESLDEQLGTALERGVAGTCVFAWTDDWHVGDAPVEGWQFGLTRTDRSPRPSLDVAAAWNRRTVANVLPKERWPSLAVVVCAFNAAATIDECLAHTCALDYEPLEIIVVDDGSTDDTASIVARHPRATLLEIEHAGLSAARNAGFQAATAEVVAYLDADAYPSPEWPYYLALGFDSRLVGGVGGPNLSPPSDPIGSQRTAHAPGGPAHVLVSDDRAEHVPGCNMAFWRDVLVEAAGFDPVYTAAGDDVDFCWRVLDKGWQIGFHPSAFVWHHRRSSVRAYLRQQRGYGRAEALVGARHPERFTDLGAARWRGVIYGPRFRFGRHGRIYRGAYGGAAFQSIYTRGGTTLDLLHQAGVPAAIPLVLTGWLALFAPWWGVPAGAAVLFLLGLVAIDTTAGSGLSDRNASNRRFRLEVALLSLAQPLARTWGRMRHGPAASRARPALTRLPGPVTRTRNVISVPECQSRVATMGVVVDALRRAGFLVLPSTGWEEPDASVVGSSLVTASIVSVGKPAGVIQLRTRRRARALAWVVPPSLVVAGLFSLVLAAILAAGVALEIGRGWWRTGRRLRQAIAGTFTETIDAASPRGKGSEERDGSPVVGSKR
jgi:cellulose synthase/poly-beta-1,6-N-acetylglucosamine synthase-like glycosyltransferase